ncbi:MAG TPA: phosphoribosylamine--glycine ligase [Blastocatellia bacterium]|jgi:phosphoribosylamine--glycine ligase|nr:phosphoribosylamine--glycine ligase [Blastocatellia bacterium]HCX28272.1 phosphoribosylamine--glycine ligase [Blastocatellia bacterium]
MKILVLGSGGREHALLWALKRTSSAPLQLYCAPGNGGISQLASCVPVSAADHSSLIEFARMNDIDLTVVGPEGPLAAGIVDQFEHAGLKIVGPSAAASRLESSKSFAKDFMRRHKIPTAAYAIANSAAEALDLLRGGKFGAPQSPVVVKADGLAAGKGVIVATSPAEAEVAVKELSSGTVVAAEASRQLLIEEALQGREVSLLLFADGRDYALMPAARDHKRVGDNDTGPNTGGMGAITDASVLEAETLNAIVRDVVEPTLEGAGQEGFPFRGILFIGLMLTANGPKVLEYNVRFGDPETQAILIRLKADLCQLFQAIVEGDLGKMSVEWSDQSSACVILASKGYPGPYETGFRLSGLDRIVTGDDLQVFHAGTSRAETGDYLTTGGRVLGITAAGATLPQALGSCYRAIKKVTWEGMQYRRDIGQFNEKLKANNV